MDCCAALGIKSMEIHSVGTLPAPQSPPLAVGSGSVAQSSAELRPMAPSECTCYGNRVVRGRSH